MRSITFVQKFCFKESMFKCYCFKNLSVCSLSVTLMTNCATDLLKAILWKCTCGKTPILSSKEILLFSTRILKKHPQIKILL